jgi:hypothetical protein
MVDDSSHQAWLIKLASALQTGLLTNLTDTETFTYTHTVQCMLASVPCPCPCLQYVKLYRTYQAYVSHPRLGRQAGG